MKQLILIGLLFSFMSVNSQDIKKLVLTVKSPISKAIPIYIEPIDNDKVLAVEYLKSSLTFNGFKLVSDRGQAQYIIRIKYHQRSDTGCGGYVIKDLDGQIMDAKNNAELVATFTFSQGAFEGKCSSDIMSALAKKINTEAK
jgi:hypothetical protein